MGHSSPPQNRGRAPQIFDHLYRGQMAGWMKTPLGTEVDLGPGDIVLDGVPTPEKGAQQPPLFGPCLLWPRSPISATAELLFETQCSSWHQPYFAALNRGRHLYSLGRPSRWALAHILVFSCLSLAFCVLCLSLFLYYSFLRCLLLLCWV